METQLVPNEVAMQLAERLRAALGPECKVETELTDQGRYYGDPRVTVEVHEADLVSVTIKKERTSGGFLHQPKKLYALVDRGFSSQKMLKERKATGFPYDDVVQAVQEQVSVASTAYQERRQRDGCHAQAKEIIHRVAEEASVSKPSVRRVDLGPIGEVWLTSWVIIDAEGAVTPAVQLEMKSVVPARDLETIVAALKAAAQEMRTNATAT